MRKKLTALCMAIVIVAVAFAFFDTETSLFNAENLSDANINSYANGREGDLVEDFANDRLDAASDLYGVIGDVSQIGGDVIGNVAGDSGLGDLGGGLGDLVEGAGDLIGGILGDSDSGSGSGGSGETYAPQNTTGGYITIIPAASEYYTVPDTNTNQTVSDTQSDNLGETVDFGATANPYTKPVGELRGGDTGDGVRWIQWIFIYTRYGLKDNGITGVFDEDTMAVVKKLQKENGMVVDGIVDDEVIDKIEYLHYQSIYSEPATFAPLSTTSKVVYDYEDEEEDNSTAIIVALIAAIWILAIVFVMIIAAAKKKSRKNLSAKKSDEGSTTVSDENKQGK